MNHDVIIIFLLLLFLLPVCEDLSLCVHSPSTADPESRPAPSAALGIRSAALLSDPHPADPPLTTSYCAGSCWSCGVKARTHQNTETSAGTAQFALPDHLFSSFTFLVNFTFECRPLPRLSLSLSGIHISPQKQIQISFRKRKMEQNSELLSQNNNNKSVKKRELVNTKSTFIH